MMYLEWLQGHSLQIVFILICVNDTLLLSVKPTAFVKMFTNFSTDVFWSANLYLMSAAYNILVYKSRGIASDLGT